MSGLSFHIVYMYMQAEAGGQFWGSSSIALYLRLVWFDWLASELQMQFFSTQFPNWHGSQFIVLSSACCRHEDSEEKGRLNRASFSLLWFAIRWTGFSAMSACHFDFLPKEDGPSLRKPWVQTYPVSVQTFPSDLWGQMWENKHWFKFRQVEYLLEFRYCAILWRGKYE